LILRAVASRYRLDPQDPVEAAGITYFWRQEMKRRSCLMAVSRVLFLTALAGQATAAPDAALLKAAKAEGEVSWYSSDSPAFNKMLADAFEKKYGINVSVFRAASGDLQQRYASERDSSRVAADVINTSTIEFFDQGLSKGWFLPLPKAAVPSYGAWPKAQKTDAAVTFSIAPFVLVYNTNLVAAKDVPKSWTDLVKPENRSRLMMADPKAAPTFLAFYRLWQQTLGADFVRNIGDAKPLLVQSLVPANEAVAAGERAFLFPGLEDFANPLIAKKAPLAIKVLGPTTGSVQYMGLSTKAKSPNAAKLFMEFILSDEAQALITRDGKGPRYSPKDALKLPPGYAAPDTQGALANRDEVLNLLKMK